MKFGHIPSAHAQHKTLNEKSTHLKTHFITNQISPLLAAQQKDQDRAFQDSFTMHQEALCSTVDPNTSHHSITLKNHSLQNIRYTEKKSAAE